MSRFARRRCWRVPEAGRPLRRCCGRYAVFSQDWNFGFGAVTICAAGGTTTGEVSAENSLVGTAETGSVGGGTVGGGVVVLKNGGVVFISSMFGGGKGAVTFIPPGGIVTGPVTAANSLIGSQAGDQVGSRGAYALEDGNYVVASPYWSGQFPNEGAVTWCSGLTGRTGNVTAANSLTGNSPSAFAGEGGITALSGGRYVVNSPRWPTATGAGLLGAVTWMDGDTEGAGIIYNGNSTTGAASGDCVGSGGVTRLANGNYVVASPIWSGNRGAVTWADGFRPSGMVVSNSNSLVGTSTTDRIGGSNAYPELPVPVTALANGHYLVTSAFWKNVGANASGAITWGNGSSGVRGEISPANSLTGTQSGQWLGSGTVLSKSDGSYAVLAPAYRSGSYAGGLGIAVLGTGFGDFTTGGLPDRRNSVLSYNQVSGPYLDADHHAATGRWAVGRGADNGVTLFSFAPPVTGKIRLLQAGADVPEGAVIDFGTVSPGQSSDRMLTIVNSGTQPLQIGNLTITDPQFAVLPPAPAGALPPGMTASLIVRFTPMAAGWQTAGLTVVSDDPIQPSLAIQLRALALPPAASPFGAAAAAPQISPLSSGGAEVRFQAVPGVTYHLQRSFDLTSWENRWLVTADEAGAVVFQDKAGTADSAFYRLKAR